jgi:hypothetical protein
LPFTPSAACSTLPEFYAYFNDSKDVRNQQWITGKQFDYKGNPVMVSTTKQGFDEDYKGADASATLNYQVEITPNVVIKNAASFDLAMTKKLGIWVIVITSSTAILLRLLVTKIMMYLFSVMPMYC